MTSKTGIKITASNLNLKHTNGTCVTKKIYNKIKYDIPNGREDTPDFIYQDSQQLVPIRRIIFVFLYKLVLNLYSFERFGANFDDQSFLVFF